MSVAADRDYSIRKKVLKKRSLINSYRHHDTLIVHRMLHSVLRGHARTFDFSMGRILMTYVVILMKSPIASI